MTGRPHHFCIGETVKLDRTTTPDGTVQDIVEDDGELMYKIVWSDGRIERTNVRTIDEIAINGADVPCNRCGRVFEKRANMQIHRALHHNVVARALWRVVDAAR